MEWCCTGKRGRGSTRPTALVQICDSTMILLIQLSAMKSKGTPASILFKGLTDPSSILEVPEKVKVRCMFQNLLDVV